MFHLFLLTIAIAILLYWLLVITEGVFLGKRIVIWLYDITAHSYDTIKEYDQAEQTLIVVEPILAGVRKLHPRVLDVATGTGRVPYFLLLDKRFDGEILGIDASNKMLDYAKMSIEKLPSHRAEKITLRQMEATSLPFPDNTFDAVTSLEALEFMPNDSAALREMMRVLRPNGFLMVTRRAGWEAVTFLHRYRSRDNMTKLLASMGAYQVRHHDWQNNYDLVTAYKKS